MEVGKFISGTVGVVVMVILVVSLVLPTITDATTGMEAGAVKTMLLVVPTLLVVAIIVGIVGMFISKRNA